MSDFDIEPGEPVQPEEVSPEAIEDVVSEEVSEEVSAEPIEEVESTEPSEEPQETRAQKRIRQLVEDRESLKSQSQKLEQQIQEQRQQMQQLFQKVQEIQTPQEPEIDYNEDPAEYLKRQQEHLAQQVEAQKNLTQQQLQYQQAVQQQQALEQQFSQNEAAYAQAHPDYFDKVDVLRNERLQMWQDMGYSQAQAAEKVRAEAMEVIHAAYQNGRDPAEYFYRMAPKANVAEQVQQTAVKQRQATSLGARGTSKGTPSVTDLATMDADEFDKLTAGDNWEKLMKSLGA